MEIERRTRSDRLYPTDVFPTAFHWQSRYYPSPYEILSQLHQFAQSHVSIIYTPQEARMATKAYNKDFRFVNRTLNAEELAHFDKWYQNKDRSADNAIEEAFADQYKCAVSYDEKNNCFIASLTLKSEKGVNVNKSLNARSDTWLEAIALVVYKHHVIFKQGEWVVDEEGRQRG